MPKGYVSLHGLHIQGCAIGFCGRLYPCYNFNHSNDYKCNAKQVAKYVQEYVDFDTGYGVPSKDLESFLSSNREYRYIQPMRVGTIELFEESNTGRQVDNSIFSKLGAPVFIYGGGNITINPNNLKDIGFPYYVDPITAYQEIGMFIGGVITNRELGNPTTGDDEVLKLSKGFDKESFRQVAPGKKARRKQNKERKR